MTRKPWPASDSEFVLPNDMMDVYYALVKNGLSPSNNSHNRAMEALCELHLLFERYCTAAGFRE